VIAVADDELTWEAVTEAAHDDLSAWCDLHRGLWEIVEPRTLELCRLRISMLVGADRHAALRSPTAGLDEELIAALPAWPTSERFTASDRACLALAEQFVIDVDGIDQPLVDAVLEHLSAGECYALFNALWAVEAVQRTCMVLDVMPDPNDLGLVAADEAGGKR
jgi:alkylhydroperoxidase family enzyme